MFVTKRRCFDFVTLFCQKTDLWKLFCKWNFLRKVEERASINELLHLFAKDQKGYPFLSIGSCVDKTEKGTHFLSILLSLKKIDKGVKFQDRSPIRATFTNTFANGINNGYPF